MGFGIVLFLSWFIFSWAYLSEMMDSNDGDDED